MDSFIARLTERIQAHKHAIVGVYGIPRGGLVFSVMLSHSLGIPCLQAPCKGCIVVDDIYDSGKALSPYIGRYEIHTMHMRERADIPTEVDYQTIVPEGIWVVYPWEKSSSEFTNL